MQAGGFSIERTQFDDHLQIMLSGELDLATAPDVSEVLDGCRHAQRVVVDTTPLEFVDSSGIGVLAEGRRNLGCRFELIAGPATDRILQLLGLKDFFGLHDS